MGTKIKLYHTSVKKGKCRIKEKTKKDKQNGREGGYWIIGKGLVYPYF
jgi:hypothetical protein